MIPNYIGMSDEELTQYLRMLGGWLFDDSGRNVELLTLEHTAAERELLRRRRTAS